MKALELRNLTVELNQRPFLKAINLTFNSGELIAIVGPNGAGKSTLLKSISGDLPVSSGNILFHGRPLAHLSSRKRACNVAVLPQHSSLQFAFSAREVVALGRIPHATGLAQDNAVVTETMRALDISDLADRFYTQLSGGEKQRVQLARVLTQIWQQSDDFPSRLLLLDEPTAHLDLGHQQQLMTVIKGFTRQGVTVVLVVHDINLAIQYADSLIAMRDGMIKAVGKPANVIQPSMVETLFGPNVSVLHMPNDCRPIVLPR